MFRSAIRGFAPLVAISFALAGQARAQDGSDPPPPLDNAGVQALQTYYQGTGIDVLNDLKVTAFDADELGIKHWRVSQTYQGIPVFGAQVIFHENPDGSPMAITDDLAWKPNPPSLTATVSRDDAVFLAKKDFGLNTAWTADPVIDLCIYRNENSQDFLAYRVELRKEDSSPAIPVYFIDALNGNILLKYDNCENGLGWSLYSGMVNIPTFWFGGGFWLESSEPSIGTFNAVNGTNLNWLFRFLNFFDWWANDFERAGVDAHFGMAQTLDYYRQVHNRKGIDGKGGPKTILMVDGSRRLVSSIVHWGANYNNAFWNGSWMTYGDGDGVTFSPLVSVDICGHEITHGVTQFTAGLIYQGVSGALNESISDIFGSMVERRVKGESPATWMLGEECYTPAVANDALRYMDKPHKASNKGYTKDDDPDHYSERYFGPKDNGGVHVNSGIFNNAFYLMAKGGTHHIGGTMVGIGADRAQRIWYYALTHFMTPRTGWRGARVAVQEAAEILYGINSPERKAAVRCFDLVGIPR